MSRIAKIFILLGIFAIASHSTVNCPYPQERSYGYNTINVTATDASSRLKSKFETFLSGFYETGGNNNNLARIKFDNKDYTVSEGIGYGMIMMVYFSDKTTSYQTHFDKLWAYYNNFLNNNGLMHWKIQGFSNITEMGAATDAEFDVALALAMAYYQFGDEKYKTAASNLIAKIRQYEMNSDGLHKPGDGWDDKKNPSYVSPAAFEIFKTFDASNSSFWSTAITKNYSLLTTNQNSTTGLPSDWSTSTGTTTTDWDGNTRYGYDASRAPWRWAWANAWYGHSQAKTLLGKLAPWVSGKTASTVGGPISLTGTLGSDKNSTFLGPFTNALSYSSTYQSDMDSYWTALIGKSSEPYFSAAMQLLTGLLATGNMPNLTDKSKCTDGPAQKSSSSGGSSSSKASSSSGANTGSTRIDNLQEGDGLARTLEAWFAYTDVNDANGKGATEIQNTVVGQSSDGPEYTVVMKDGNDWVVKLDRYKLSQGQNPYDPYAALGLKAENNQKNTSQGGYDLSKCTNGFSYDYKGAAHNFKVKLSTVKDYAYHYKEAASSTGWKTETIALSALAQPSGWGDPVTFEAKKINGFEWEVKGGVSTTEGSLAIKNFDCLGNMPLPQGSTPILLSPIATKNATQLISNGISLQSQNNASLEIFNMNGTLLRKMDFSSGIYTVEFSDLPKGLYIAKIRFGNSSREILKVPVR